MKLHLTNPDTNRINYSFGSNAQINSLSYHMPTILLIRIDFYNLWNYEKYVRWFVLFTFRARLVPSSVI